MFVAQDIGSAARGPGDDFWYYPVGTTAAGVRISPQTAIAVTTMFACALVMGQTMGMLPVHLYRRLGEGKGQERATDHPLYRIIHRQPNRWQTAFQWRQMMQWHLMLRYNSYSEILYGRGGQVSELIPIHPDRVTVDRLNGADGVQSFRYKVRSPNGANERTLIQDEMFHVRGLSSDGIEGFSPLDAQRESLGEALAAQSYSSRHLQNDARSPIALEWPGHFKDDEERRKFRASWQEAQTGPNRGKTPVLEKGMTIKEIGVSNTDLQLIELRKLKAYDIAAMNRMPPHKVGLMERATFTNIEHQGIEFATDTTQPWCVNWEQELSRQLLQPDQQEEFYFEFAMNALLRGDAKSRAEFYGKMFQTASLSPNDIRRFENENPIEGGNRRFIQANMMPLDRVDDVVDRGQIDRSGNDKPDGNDAAEKREATVETAAAERVTRKEVTALRRLSAKAAGAAEFREEAERFYQQHAGFVAEVMAMGPEAALGYVAGHLQRLHAVMQIEGESAGAGNYIEYLEQHGARELLTAARKKN